jgi:hypothetical protein
MPVVMLYVLRPYLRKFTFCSGSSSDCSVLRSKDGNAKRLSQHSGGVEVSESEIRALQSKDI